MIKNVNTVVQLMLLALSFFVFGLINNTFFSELRLDLTQNNLYTLSEGSLEIIKSVNEPVDLYYFFSEEVSRDLTGLRAYAKQVDSLLGEYEIASKGKIRLHRINPEPFSEEEDQAATFNLQSVPVNNMGETLYFGLAGENAAGKQLAIPFFQPDKETFLEYDVSKLLQGLVQNKKPVVGLLSSIAVREDMDMQTFQPVPAWMLIQQLEQLFEVRNVEPDIKAISTDIDLLVLIHPKALDDDMLFAIDQFVMSGGRLLAFIDPYPERDRVASANPMMPGPAPEASQLNKLLFPWGVSLREGVVIGDANAALSVGAGPSGQAVRHLAIIGMDAGNFTQDDITVSSLENINFASAGILDISIDHGTSITPIIQSGSLSAPIDVARLQFLSNPADLQSDFTPTGEQYTIALRLSGRAVSAFPEKEGAITSTEDINVIVISDTDLLTDQLWVQVQDFFGQSIASPWANNGDFVTNVVDNLLGSSALIGIRSRGEFSRPFDAVISLQQVAEAKYLKSADTLQTRLTETEQQLSSLENSQTTLSKEQEKAISQFQDEKLKIRKELREVRHQLDKDIDGLGSTLKFLNIIFIPILLTLMLIMFNYIRTSRSV
ncbi:MAG: ABC-type uncharacterized transport system involved in gliding motility auxiliary subunit [Candidatus Azotimanducaceae bacterium]|jgi:ABC-type uncharacterized transport system involved in gliding motility auxiliary subunit